ncbi:DUF4157 domain-containing protein [Chitinophaga sp. GCM10012297]|uniref:DUF4157 domain-containing protein n=1 Tax=Chitinophaga chungangae TaxID=2821488 RepID=A0ABS3YCV1_9BACT|nr:DUF4157 domain-containing protein [Chitinophaga chungangae]MBO9152505.1 DUF4157 domain-containing protein [Chitinophaga chungangae]
MEKLYCRIRENSWVARLAALKMGSSAIAIVFGRVIHLHGVSRETFLANTRWVRHEVRHVRQYRQHGFFPFLWRYVNDWVRFGYYNSPFEKDARQAEHNATELDGVEIA